MSVSDIGCGAGTSIAASPPPCMDIAGIRFLLIILAARRLSNAFFTLNLNLAKIG